MSWLKGIFGETEAATLPVGTVAGVELPLGLRPGGAIALDPTLFHAAGGRLGFVAPEGNNLIEAYGQINLGAGALLHRFYLTDDAFLQVNTTSGVIDEMKYFVFIESRQPANQAAFQAWAQPGSQLGAPYLELEGRRYTRVWGDSPQAAWIPPVVFDESVYRGQPPALDYDLTHYAMLFQRVIPELNRSETLLVSAEDYGPTEFIVSFSLGIDVTTADLEIT